MSSCLAAPIIMYSVMFLYISYIINRWFLYLNWPLTFKLDPQPRKIRTISTAFQTVRPKAKELNYCDLCKQVSKSVLLTHATNTRQNINAYIRKNYHQIKRQTEYNCHVCENDDFNLYVQGHSGKNVEDIPHSRNHETRFRACNSLLITLYLNITIK